MQERIRRIWSDSEIDRAYMLALLGYAPHDCNTYSLSLWRDLPIDVRNDLENMRGAQ
jgi:hypothetical protein